jgi:hypothetical protein
MAGARKAIVSANPSLHAFMALVPIEKAMAK